MFQENNRMDRRNAPAHGRIGHSLHIPSAFRTTLPIYIVLPVWLVVGIAVLVLTVRTLSVWLATATPTDAFSAYETVSSMQPTTILAQFPCEDEPPPRPIYVLTGSLCHFSPETGAFWQVGIILQAEESDLLWFQTRNIRVIDLVWRWGLPDSFTSVNGKYVSIIWQGHLQAIATQKSRYSLQLPVKFIFLSDPAF